MPRRSLPHLVLASVALIVLLGTQSAAQPTSVRWVTGYYAAYSEASANMPPSQFDYTVLSHVIHWPVVPRADGTFDPNDFGMTPAQSMEVVSRAHAVGTKAILGFGGDVPSVGDGWRGATSPANRATFITNMVNLMRARGYDGIDINWEGLGAADGPQFTAFSQELRAALDQLSPRPLLTIVPTTGPDAPVSLVAAVQQAFDQINIQTYVMSGAYPGWVTWFNSPLFNSGLTFPGTTGQVPSSDDEVNRFVVGGIPVGNLGIGIQFDGVVWAGGSGTDTGGVSKPRQSWTYGPPFQPDGSDPGAPSFNLMRTADIISTFTEANGFHKTFDDVARVPWIGRDAPADADDRFISFDDEQAIQEKAQYIGQKGIGGIFVFELSGDFFPNATGDARHPLLTGVRNSFRVQTSAPTVSLGLNQSTLRPGETLVLTATLSPGSTPTTVDAYVVLRLPSGSFLSLLLGGQVVPGIVPIARGISPFAFRGELLRYPFSGSEPVGDYAWLAGLTTPGTLTVIGIIAQQSFTFGP